MDRLVGKILLGLGAVTGFVVLAGGSACGSDACQTLADQVAACGGPTSSTTASTGTSGEKMPPVCSDKEKRQAQCVLDARVNGAPIDMCKINSKTASAQEQQVYDNCYSAMYCVDGNPAPCN